MKSGAIKKALLIAILLIAYILWQAIGTLSEYYPINNYPPPHRGEMTFLGDGLSQKNNHGFVSLLSKRLAVPINDRSIASTSMHEAKIEIEKIIKATQPSVVILCYKNTDRSEEGVRVYLADLRELTLAAQKEGAVTVLLGAERGDTNKIYEKSIKRLARETRSIVVPNILTTIDSNARFWNGDIPNDEGELRIADLIAPSLEGLTIGIAQNTSSTP